MCLARARHTTVSLVWLMKESFPFLSLVMCYMFAKQMFYESIACCDHSRMKLDMQDHDGKKRKTICKYLTCSEFNASVPKCNQLQISHQLPSFFQLCCQSQGTLMIVFLCGLSSTNCYSPFFILLLKYAFCIYLVSPYEHWQEFI